MRIGIIDIGSNSVRLVIMELTGNQCMRVINDLKETVRLGKDMTPDGGLDPARMDKAIEALRVFKSLSEALKVEVLMAVATEAVRKASNQEEFVQRVLRELGINIRTLSGNEEAYYDYFGSINSLDIEDGLLIDIGGASTEIVRIQDRKLLDSLSIPWGAINLTDRFNLSGRTDTKTESQLKQLREFMINLFESIPWLKKAKGLPVIGVGGTIRNIGKICRKNEHYPLDFSHNYTMKRSQVLEIYNEIKDKNYKERKKVKGLSKERADIFVAALGVVSYFMEYCDSEKLIVSGYGLREGLAYEYLLNSKEPLSDVLDFSLKNTVMNYGLDMDHANKIWDLAQSLFLQLKPLHLIPDYSLKVLKTAAMLHDCGIKINYYNHSLHSIYMIINSQIKGLTHKELLMAAYTAGSHRNDDVKILNIHKALLSEEEMASVRKLGLIVQISESFDRRMNGNVEEIDCDIQSDKVTLTLHARENVSVEIQEAMVTAPKFQTLFQRQLEITVNDN